MHSPRLSWFAARAAALALCMTFNLSPGRAQAQALPQKTGSSPQAEVEQEALAEESELEEAEATEAETESESSQEAEAEASAVEEEIAEEEATTAEAESAAGESAEPAGDITALAAEVEREEYRPPNVPIYRAYFHAQPAGSRVFLGPVLPKDDGYSSGAWQRRLEADEFVEICTSPCDAPLYPGKYRLALAPHLGGPVRAKGMMTVDADTNVEANYRSNKVKRIIGWVTMVGSVVGGSAMMFAGVAGCDGTSGSCVKESPLLWAGASVFILGVPTGLWLTLQDDKVSFSATKR